METVKYVTICNKIMVFPPRRGENQDTPHNPFPELQATLVHLPYGLKLIINCSVKSTFRIISGHLRAWKKQSRYVKITNSKAGGRMKARRLPLSVSQLPRMAVCLHKQWTLLVYLCRRWRSLHLLTDAASWDNSRMCICQIEYSLVAGVASTSY